MSNKTYMTKEREALLDRVIKVYGLEHEVTVGFAWLCENSLMSDQALECLCKAHEVFPYKGDQE